MENKHIRQITKLNTLSEIIKYIDRNFIPKPKEPLTRVQLNILNYIKDYIEEKGYSPRLQDIVDHFNYGAMSTAFEHVSNLKRKGYIYKEMNSSRSITVIE